MEEEEETEEQSISLQKMYQKHQMDAILTEAAFDIDDAITQPESEESLLEEKTETNK